jgi:hypothetical protein
MENGDTKRSRRVWRKGGTGNLTFSYLGKDDGGWVGHPEVQKIQFG